jgi:hypothetical protein
VVGLIEDSNHGQPQIPQHLRRRPAPARRGERPAEGRGDIQDRGLIKVIDARGHELTKAQLELVTSCADLGQLAAWFDQALDATTTDEIFGAH